MIEKKTVIDRIEVDRAGVVGIRFGLLLVENGVEIDCKWHRTAIEPGGSVDAQIAAVDAHLQSMGKATVEKSGGSVDRLKSIVTVVHTDEVKAAHAAERAKRVEF